MSSRRVMVVVPDLFFAARIVEVGKQTGAITEVVEPARALDVARAAPPDLVVIDLEGSGDPLSVIRALRADPSTRGIPILGFYPHVRHELRQAALAAGADRALPRSAFTVRLSELLTGEGHAST